MPMRQEQGTRRLSIFYQAQTEWQTGNSSDYDMHDDDDDEPRCYY